MITLRWCVRAFAAVPKKSSLGEFEEALREYKKYQASIVPDMPKKKFDRYFWKDPKKSNEPVPAQTPTAEYPNMANYKYEEFGVLVKGPEPTRHNEWERNGRTTDF